jgi:hypothetical protein
MTEGSDRVLEAIRRLLADASAGGQAKVDALVALVQRQLVVPTWQPGDDSGFRTLVNPSGESALPVFTGTDELEAAATRFGWKPAEGSTPAVEVGARKALRHAIAHELQYVVVDITADHALEIGREELEPLLTPRAARESSGPYAGVGRISSSMLGAVKPTPRPEYSEQADKANVPKAPPVPEQRQGGGQTPPDDPQQAPQGQGQPQAPSGHSAGQGRDPGLTVKSSMTSAPPTEGAATFGSGTSVRLVPLQEQPSDEMLDALSAILREYPEIEWASFCAAARGPAEPRPTVGLRVDTSFRERLNEIISRLRSTGDEHGAALDVLLLDDPDVMRAAREAIVFYPWRR